MEDSVSAATLEASDTFSVPDGGAPQNREFADKCGAYTLVSRMSRAIVDPGDALAVELFITGYGAIRGAKLLVYPSPGIYDTSKSSLTAGCKVVGNRTVFGGQSWPMAPGCSFWIDLGTTGVANPRWKGPTLFFDVRPDTHLIMTEMAFPWTPPEGDYHGPITLSLKLNDRAAPGAYDIRFVLTYYNGESWVTSAETAQFSVRTWYQRWETWCQTAAVAAALIALLALIAQVFMK